MREDVERAFFRVNPAYAHDLRDALESRTAARTGKAPAPPAPQLGLRGRFAKALRLWPWLAAIASGLLYLVAFLRSTRRWLCWIALTPLLAAIWFRGEDSKRRWLRDLLLGYVAGLTFFLDGFFLAQNRHRSWLVPGGALHGDLFRRFWSLVAVCCRPRCPSKNPFRDRRTCNGHRRSLTSRHRSFVSPWLSSFHNLLLAFCSPPAGSRRWNGYAAGSSPVGAGMTLGIASTGNRP